MIILFSILLLSLIPLCIHLCLLPLSKRRAIIFKGYEGSLFFFMITAVCAYMIHPFLYLIAFLIAGGMYYFNIAIIYGIISDNIHSALASAIVAVRATSMRTQNTYTINGTMQIKIFPIIGKIHIVQSTIDISSKKNLLISNLFKKFIQNHSL